MSIYEYDEELHIKTMMDIGREEGLIEGEIIGKVLAYYEMGCDIETISTKMNLSTTKIKDILDVNSV